MRIVLPLLVVLLIPLGIAEVSQETKIDLATKKCIRLGDEPDVCRHRMMVRYGAITREMAQKERFAERMKAEYEEEREAFVQEIELEPFRDFRVERASQTQGAANKILRKNDEWKQRKNVFFDLKGKREDCSDLLSEECRAIERQLKDAAIRYLDSIIERVLEHLLADGNADPELVGKAKQLSAHLATIDPQDYSKGEIKDLGAAVKEIVDRAAGAGGGGVSKERNEKVGMLVLDYWYQSLIAHKAVADYAEGKEADDKKTLLFAEIRQEIENAKQAIRHNKELFDEIILANTSEKDRELGPMVQKNVRRAIRALQNARNGLKKLDLPLQDEEDLKKLLTKQSAGEEGDAKRELREVKVLLDNTLERFNSAREEGEVWERVEEKIANATALYREASQKLDNDEYESAEEIGVRIREMVASARDAIEEATSEN